MFHMVIDSLDLSAMEVWQIDGPFATINCLPKPGHSYGRFHLPVNQKGFLSAKAAPQVPQNYRNESGLTWYFQ